METTATTTDLGQPDKPVSRVVILLWLAVFVAIAVLIIDQGIKRAIVAEAEKAGKLLAEVRKAAREANGGTQPAGEATAGPGDSVNADHGVDDASGASAESVPDAGNGLGPEAGRVSRPFGGPRGDG